MVYIKKKKKLNNNKNNTIIILWIRYLLSTNLFIFILIIRYVRKNLVVNNIIELSKI